MSEAREQGSASGDILGPVHIVEMRGHDGAWHTAEWFKDQVATLTAQRDAWEYAYHHGRPADTAIREALDTATAEIEHLRADIAGATFYAQNSDAALAAEKAAHAAQRDAAEKDRDARLRAEIVVLNADNDGSARHNDAAVGSETEPPPPEFASLRVRPSRWWRRTKEGT